MFIPPILKKYGFNERQIPFEEIEEIVVILTSGCDIPTMTNLKVFFTRTQRET
jgi:hypothetical protein